MVGKPRGGGGRKLPAETGLGPADARAPTFAFRFFR